MKLFLLLLILSTTVSAQWIKQTVNTNASFRGLSVVNEKVVWASGTGGTVIKTTDGGKTWSVMTVPGAEKLDFRDIEAFDANTAYILSIGNGENSRIYKTTDGGATWKLQYTNPNEKAFFDAIACWDMNHCLAMSDPVDGRYILLSTDDGGATGTMIDTSKMPAAKEGEAAFAASGTCLITVGTNSAFLVSGGTDARVFRSQDRGRTWTVAASPIMKGTAGSGIFSIAMYDAKNGVIVGGNYEKPNEVDVSNVALTSDGGKTWKPSKGLHGFRSAATFIDKNTVIAVGTNGTDISPNGGKAWSKIGTESLNAVAAKGERSIWAVGPNGGVYRLSDHFLASWDCCGIKFVTHLPDVTAITLSHRMIAPSCVAADKDCAANSKVAVATTYSIYENDPYYLRYDVTAGTIVGTGSNVEWDLTGVPAGKYTITASLIVPSFGGTWWEAFGKTQTSEIVIR